MKTRFTLLLLLICGLSFAQSTRNIRYRILNKDSVNIHFDENYFMIEDSCSSIIRHAHMNTKDRTFFGAFRDISRANPDLVVSEGHYNNSGALDVPFISRFLDGNVQAVGTFNNGKMIGKWTINYADNKPRLGFEEANGITRVLNAWDDTGKQTIINGVGNFTANLGRVYWVGKLQGGTPEGSWKFRNLDDRSGSVLVTETFKKGAFVKGIAPTGSYSNASRLVLVDVNMLPVNNAALIQISTQNCDPTKSRKRIQYATYKDGNTRYSEELNRVIKPILAKIDFSTITNKEFNIEGIVSEKGKITSLKYVNSFDERISTALLQSLYTLPFLEPTLVNGVPTETRIRFNFIFTNAIYKTRWQILPLSN